VLYHLSYTHHSFFGFFGIFGLQFAGGLAVYRMGQGPRNCLCRIGPLVAIRHDQSAGSRVPGSTTLGLFVLSRLILFLNSRY
jgi:hypothetical protein